MCWKDLHNFFYCIFTWVVVFWMIKSSSYFHVFLKFYLTYSLNKYLQNKKYASGSSLNVANRIVIGKGSLLTAYKE